MRDQVWEETVLRLERGEAWPEVEAALMRAPAGLSEDERAALWLRGWSYRPGGASAAERVRAVVGG